MTIHVNPPISVGASGVAAGAMGASAINAAAFAGSAINTTVLAGSAIKAANVAASVIGLETYSTAGLGVVASALWEDSYVGHIGASSVGAELAKMDQLSTSGLAGVSNSLSYRVHEVERHMHSYESWFCLATTADAEAHVADRVGQMTDTCPFVIDAGNKTWGAWVQIAGSADTPTRPGNIKYDPHKMFVTAVERASTVHFIQVGFGEAGSTALSASSYTEFVYRSGAATTREAPIEFQTRRQDAGTKMWARCYAVGQDTATLSFYVGVHEYEG